jgi:O-antigen/teichoic acid export membrane protein
MELDEETRVMAKGIAWQNVANVSTKLLAFVYTIIIARFVSQEEVGLFYFGMGIVGLFSIFADLGFTTSVIRYVPYYLGKKDVNAAGRTVSLTVIVGVSLLFASSISLYALSGALAAFFANPKLEPVLMLFAIQLAISQVYLIASSILTSLKRIKESGIASVSQTVLKLAFTVALIFSLGADAKSLALAFMVSYVLGTFYLIYELRRCLGWMPRDGKFDLSGHWEAFREMVPFGVTMVSVMLFGTIIASSDRIMIGYFGGEAANAQIAVYSIATGLGGLVGLFAGSIFAIFFPLISEIVGREDWGKVTKTSQTAVRWALYSSMPMLAFLVAFAAPMLRILYGREYEVGSAALAFYSVGLFVTYFGATQRTVLASMRLLKVEFFSIVVGAVVNLVLNYILIPPFGIAGSGFASMVAFFSMTYVNHHYAKKFFGFEIPGSIWRNIACGLVVFVVLQSISMAAYARLVNLPFSFGESTIASAVIDKIAKLAVLSVFFAIGCGVYLLLLNLLHLFEHEDARVFQGILKKFGLPHWMNMLAMRMVFWNQKEIH